MIIFFYISFSHPTINSHTEIVSCGDMILNDNLYHTFYINFQQKNVVEIPQEVNSTHNLRFVRINKKIGNDYKIWFAAENDNFWGRGAQTKNGLIFVLVLLTTSGGNALFLY